MEQLKLQDILESDKEMILENIAADSSPAAVVNVLDRELDRMLYRYAEGCPDENAVTAAGNMIKSIKNSLPFMEAVDDVKEWKLTGDTEENKRKLRLAGIILTILGLASAAASFFLQLSRTSESASVSLLNTALPLAAGIIMIFIGGLIILTPRKQKKGKPEDTKLEFRVNPGEIYRVLKGIMLSADKSLEDMQETARLEKEKSLMASGGSDLKPEEAELFSSLLESLYTKRNTEKSAETDEMISGIRYYLYKKNVEIVNYSREQASSFELLPGKKTGTLRPALMANGRLLKKGLASSAEEF